MADKRVIIANPDEPKTGDFGFQFYHDARPIDGDDDTKRRAAKALRGLRGKEITVTVRGQRISESGKKREWVSRRTVEFNTYSDVFGSGGAYHSALKGQMKKNSSWSLVTMSITVEPSTGEDDSE